MEKSVETGFIQLNIPFDEQMNVYNDLSDSTLKEIWSMNGWQVFPETPQDTFRIINMKTDGKYLEFLERTGKNDTVIKQYHESLRSAGDLSPALIAGLLVNYEFYDIEDIRVKFIVAIHYLTLNDRFERHEKYSG